LNAYKLPFNMSNLSMNPYFLYLCISHILKTSWVQDKYLNCLNQFKTMLLQSICRKTAWLGVAILCSLVSVGQEQQWTPADKAAGLIPQPEIVPYYGEYPNVSHNIVSSDERFIDGCYIPHDPATWIQSSFVNGGGGGDNQDDGSNGPIAVPFGFDFFGTSYNQFWLNINGNISFDGPYWHFSPTGFPNSDFVMLAPFWGDVDLGGTGEVWYNVTPDAIYVNWVGVGYYNTHTDLVNTFQLIITDGTNPLIGIGNNVAFYYDDMQWTTGDSSGGSGGFGGSPATVGANVGNGVDFFQIGRFDHPGLDYDGPNGDNDGVDYLDDQCLEFNVSEDENFPPIAQNFPENNTITMCPGDEMTFTVNYTGPEGDQDVTVDVDANSFGGLVVNSNTSGNPSATNVTITAGALGNSSIIFTGTDNHVDAASTVVELNIIVEQCCVPNPTVQCLPNVDVECNTPYSPDITGTPQILGSTCGENFTLDFEDELLVEDDCNTYYNRTWTLYDDNGDFVDDCPHIIHIFDSELPTLIYPDNLYYSFEWGVLGSNVVDDFIAGDITEGELAALAPELFPILVAQGFFFPTGIDNCAEVDINLTQTFIGSSEFDCPQVARVIWTFNAEDDCENQSPAIDVICDFFDTTPPVITTVLEDISVDCNDGQVDMDVDIEAYDTCSDNVTIVEKQVLLANNFDDCTGFRSQTPGGWGSSANGNNPGVYRDANFFNAFPSGLQVGCDFTLSLTSASDVEAFLPSGGTPSALTEDLANPTNYGNTLAGHIVAATLSIGFDANDPNFSENDLPLTDLVYNNGPFLGWTLAEVLEEANKVLGGCDSDYSASFMTEAVAMFNENYVDGTTDNGNFSCEGQEIECNFEYFQCWIATDECGNSSTISRTVIITDSTPPVLIGVPDDIAIECGDVPDPAVVTATDNCTSEITVSMVEEVIPQDCGYLLIRTWVAHDNCDNTASDSQVITVADTTPPVISGVPDDVEMYCELDVIEYNVTAFDNCDGLVEVSFSEVIGEGCPYIVTRTWTAIDACGNAASDSQVITVGDDVPPMIEVDQTYISVECDEVENIEEPFVSDECTDVDVTFEDVLMSGGCYGTLYRTWTGTDACGNAATAVQYISITDFTPPTIYGVGDDMTVECDAVTGPPVVWSEDNCGGDVQLVFEEEVIPGACPNEWTIIWTWTATDHCDNVATAQKTVEVVDTTNPEFVNAPQDVEVSCDQPLPPVVDVEATDNCGSAGVTFNEINVDGSCPQTYSIERTWTATDLCGNMSAYTQYIYVYDSVAPVFTFVPGDVTIECDQALPTDEAEALDNCGLETTWYEDEVVPTDCDEEYAIFRTYYALDQCGNQNMAFATITVEDNTAPELSSLPADAELDCEDEVPSPPNVSATDNCDNDVQVIFSEEFFGDFPDPDADEDCQLIQPEGPFYNPDWALWLQGFPGGYDFYTIVSGEWLAYPDGSAHIIASVVSVDNPAAGWDLDIELENGMDWDSWSNQEWPTSYKDDFNLVGVNYLDWMYYLITNASNMTGTGDFIGSYLNITHAPSGLYYGYQVGNASNNVNEEYGSGGWFTYDGNFIDASQQLNVDASGAGDLAFDHDCCPQYEVVWTWTATDCAGNQVSHSSTVTFGENQDLAFQEVTCMGDFNVDHSVNTMDLLIILAEFGCDHNNCNCDLTADYRTNTSDLLAFLSYFGQACE
jgi:hypothetical protein